MSLKQKAGYIFSLMMTLKDTLKHKDFTIITKANTNLGIEGEGIKNIISLHEGGYILIRWS